MFQLDRVITRYSEASLATSVLVRPMATPISAARHLLAFPFPADPLNLSPRHCGMDPPVCPGDGETLSDKATANIRRIY